jgi:hypothetical protein
MKKLIADYILGSGLILPLVRNMDVSKRVNVTDNFKLA